MVFRDARLKVKRANEHIREAEKRIKLITAPESQTSRIEIHAEARVKSVHYHLDRLKDLPEVALVVGDAIHNLKTALDYVWVQVTATLFPRSKIRAKFPVFPTIDHLKDGLIKDGITAASPLFKFILREIQPYDGGNFYIRPLHQMDIMDKHKLLIPSTNYGSVVGLKVKDQHGPVTGRKRTPMAVWTGR
jgi:hypothetical protein